MALLEVLHFPDKRLRTVAKPVTVFDEKLSQLVDDMLETMYQAPGVGLAATQVNIHQQVIVIDVSEDKNQSLCLINPVLQEQQGTETCEEGCLSVPGIYESVQRAEKVIVEANNPQGQSFSVEADGLLAVCIQHEMEHLQGKLFIDNLSPLKQRRIRSKLEKRRRQAM
ncbi:peptide deformylase [Candidatus Venteria ishoeyi]|uniref:Peptide deformylase n=1 Tax=Candidatus Venteria ishoeyi TaxID=1899563 RepID=A0A1H6F6E9_9GAMM|nr:peptide deformylase [Candidatus Venteria ishoeyi]MDM8548093.1 peptide deformylase [Candidatus Venteria ishoeyi]SEH05692.1 Peptide deformylase [Candidatus Venteria ishoeyi]